MTRLTAALPVLALLAACAGTPTDPPHPDDVVIAVRITGGFAGIDRTITLEGRAATVRVCDRGCPAPPGEVVKRLEQNEIQALAKDFVDAGARADEERAFGICELCADQRHLELTYRDRTGSHRFVGDEPNFPDDLVGAIHSLEGTAISDE